MCGIRETLYGGKCIPLMYSIVSYCHFTCIQICRNKFQYPTFRCTSFDDTFLALLVSEGFTGNIAFDGSRRVVSVSADRTMKIWELPSGKCLGTIPNNSISVGVNCDGTRAISGSQDGKLRLWDLSEGTCLALLEGHPRRPDFDPAKLQELRVHFEEVYRQLSKFTSPANERVDSDILVFQVPGGMLSNFRNQLAEQNMSDKFDEVVREIPVVREALGWIPLVTPTSQIVGTQAMMNVKFGRWKVICQPAQDIALGKYGKAPGPINPEILEKVEKQSGQKAVTQRPADLLSPGLEGYRQQCADKHLPTNDEMAVLFAMFPQQVEALVKGVPAEAPKPAAAAAVTPQAAPQTTKASPAAVSSPGTPAAGRRDLVLTIDGVRHEVTVESITG